jgi:hypothetical protein
MESSPQTQRRTNWAVYQHFSTASDSPTPLLVSFLSLFISLSLSLFLFPFIHYGIFVRKKIQVHRNSNQNVLQYWLHLHENLCIRILLYTLLRTSMLFVSVCVYFVNFYLMVVRNEYTQVEILACY